MAFKVHHGAVFTSHPYGEKDNRQHEIIIKTKGQTLYQKSVRGQLPGRILDSRVLKTCQDKAHFCGNPSAHKRERSDGRGSGINNESQLFTGNARSIRHRSHGLANKHAIGEAIKENKPPHGKSPQPSTTPAHVFAQETLCDSQHTAISIQKFHNTTHKEREENDTDVPWLGQNRDQMLIKKMHECPERISVIQQQTPRKCPYKQGKVNIAGHESQYKSQKAWPKDRRATDGFGKQDPKKGQEKEDPTDPLLPVFDVSTHAL